MPVVKIALRGAAKVGKTQILKRLTKPEYSFPANTQSISPIDFDQKFESAKDGTGVKFMFWDIPGGQLLDPLSGLQLTDASLVFLCCDPKVSDSFLALDQQVSDIRLHCPDARLVLVKTKSDITDSPDAVTKQQIADFIKKHQIEHAAVDVSAKDGTGMDELLEHARQVAESLQLKEKAQQSSAGSSTGSSSFCLNALLATAAAGGLALCVAALVTALVVSSLPLSIALFAAGATSGLTATGMFFYRRCNRDNDAPQGQTLASAYS